MQKILFYLKLIPRILINFLQIVYEEAGNFFRRLGWIKSAVIIVVIAALAVGGAWWFHNKNKMAPDLPDDYFMTLKEAAKMGEMTTHKLLIQIENPKGNPENIKGRYQRGDIVMAVPGDREFSDAEKTGFLIIQMELTDKQAELLMRPQETIGEETDESGRPVLKQVKRRKYIVDLAKVGIGPEVERGRVIDDKVFKWDVVAEKEMEQ